MLIRAIGESRHAFSPEEVAVLTTVFDGILKTLNLANREDPLTILIAKKIIELAIAGERDPVRLRERTLAALGN
jgi:hypothetical protein